MPNKAMSKKPDKIYNISVVGLSGTEKEKGSSGVGKSCLINRFIRPLADDYYTDHISVLSQSDFAGRVVNNDHFLYWGSTTKVEDGMEYTFRIVEQTEFVDDSSFQPFKIGKTDPYYKRCAMCKLQSAEKLAYICKNQLGLEHEFDEQMMPEGRFNVDGFVCVFDVSLASNRPIEIQLDHVYYILTHLIKTKKPIVVATTKNDEVHKPLVTEVERLLQKKDLKERGNIPIIETSAHENVNIDLAFMTLVNIIEKSSKNRNKIPSYADACKVVMETKEVTRNAFMSLIKSHVGVDYKALWIPIRQQLQSNVDFVRFIELFGTDEAGKMFKKYLVSLKEDHIRMRQKKHLERLECVLKELLPGLDAVADKSWYSMRMWLQNHDNFPMYFVVLPDNLQWRDNVMLDRNDGRIPWDLMMSQEAELVYRNYINHLRIERRKIEFKREFRQLLEDCQHIQPGQPLQEVTIYFIGRECFSSLSDKDKLDIYDEYQKLLKDKAKLDFQELLHENAELFMKYENCQISTDDVKDINNKLQHEYRYKCLSYLDEDRRSLVLKHLGFIHRASKERCMFRETCSDHQLETILNCKFRNCVQMLGEPYHLNHLNNKHLHIAIIGHVDLAQQFHQDIRTHLNNDQLEIDNDLLQLEFHIFNNNFNILNNINNNNNIVEQLIQLESQPKIKFHGYFMLCSTLSSLESFQHNLPHFFKSSNTPPSTTTTTNMTSPSCVVDVPIVLVLGHDPSITEEELIQLRDRGVTLSKSLNILLVDTPSSLMVSSNRYFHRDQVELALHNMLTFMKLKVNIKLPWQLTENVSPDIKILMCFMCGDLYDMTLPLTPLLNHQSCHVSKDHQQTLNLEVYLDENRRKVSVTCCSYHEANKLITSLFHGCILVYSHQRLASLSNLKAFALKTKAMPLRLLAVLEGSTHHNNIILSTTTTHHNNNILSTSIITQHLLNEGKMFAENINASFMTTSPNFQQQIASYTPFFKECWDQRLTTELLYSSSSSSSSPLTHHHNKHKRHSSVSEKMKHRPPAALPRRINNNINNYNINNSNNNINKIVGNNFVVNSNSLDVRSNASSSADDSEPSFIYHMNLESDVDRGTSTSAHPYLLDPLQPDDLYSEIHTHDTDQLIQPSKSPHHKHKRDKSSSFIVASTDASHNSSEKKRLPSNFLKTKMSNTTKGTKPPPNMEPIQFADYAHPVDMLSLTPAPPPPSSSSCTTTSTNQHVLYASVVDALPTGKLQRIKLNNMQDENKIEEDNNDVEGEPTYSNVIINSINNNINNNINSNNCTNNINNNIANNNNRHHQHHHHHKLGLLKKCQSFEDAISLLSHGEEDKELIHQDIPEAETCCLSEGSDTASNELLVAIDNRIKKKRHGDKKKGALKGSMEPNKDMKSMDGWYWKRWMRTNHHDSSASNNKPFKKDRSSSSSSSPADKIKKDTKQHRLSTLCQSSDKLLPLFVEKCISHIEQHGMSFEGIYRVPGNRAHVNYLIERFHEDPTIDFVSMDLPANVIATALKSFFQNLVEPLVPEHYHPLINEAICKEDRMEQMNEIRHILNKLPPANQQVLKYIIIHISRVSEHQSENNMDPRNLSICWWPTLTRPTIISLDLLQTISKPLELFVLTLIQNSHFFFPSSSTSSSPSF